MVKMSRSEAFQIFEQSQKIKKILQGNVSLVDAAINDRSSSALSFHLGTVDSLENFVIQNLNELNEASERAGWWSKKIARSYHVEIRQLFLHYKSGINVLAHIVNPGLDGSIFDQDACND